MEHTSAPVIAEKLYRDVPATNLILAPLPILPLTDTDILKTWSVTRLALVSARSYTSPQARTKGGQVRTYDHPVCAC